MQPRRNAGQRPHAGQAVGPAGQQGVAPAQGRAAHAADVPLEMPGRHEFGHHRLGTDFGMAHVHRAAAGEGLHQRRWQHQVTQAQRRERHLAEGADIQHAPTAIQRRQRRQGRAAVTVLAVVVVLDDPTAATLGPGQQLQAPRQAHHHAQRVLVGRRDIRHTTVIQGVKHLAIHALAVYRHAMQSRAGQGERMAGSAITRVFHRHAVPRLDQQLCTKANRLLRATGDHNLFSCALHATGTAQIGGDQTAQTIVTGRVAIAQQFQVRLAPERPIQLGPYIKREQVEGRHTHTKGSRRSRWRMSQVVVFYPRQARAVDNFVVQIFR
ncbi:hypothetical protein ALP97_05283 [Pseudomonas salomonii]|uniref:Uncharacterized protein n=1 Tax=Pseudomonas salomonii TaxID=191391 RepID=A0A3M4QRI4_9PSED|nr:hypothetical protein ALP97_05283 [Pseudomonas salomonii]